MIGASLQKSSSWTIEAFRAFLDTRPDEERWELIDGAAIMMTPPTLIHQRIASNLDRLLNDALARHDRTRMAIQRPGLDLLPLIENYQPEPDVAVIDWRARRGERYARRSYLAAEIVSETDIRRDRLGDRSRIEAKRAIYRRHDPCLAILVIEADRLGIEIDTRADGAWSTMRLSEAEDQFALPAFGLRCRLVDLYDGTEFGSA